MMNTNIYEYLSTKNLYGLSYQVFYKIYNVVYITYRIDFMQLSTAGIPSFHKLCSLTIISLLSFRTVAAVAFRTAGVIHCTILRWFNLAIAVFYLFSHKILQGDLFPRLVIVDCRVSLVVSEMLWRQVNMNAEVRVSSPSLYNPYRTGP